MVWSRRVRRPRGGERAWLPGWRRQTESGRRSPAVTLRRRARLRKDRGVRRVLEERTSAPPSSQRRRSDGGSAASSARRAAPYSEREVGRYFTAQRRRLQRSCRSSLAGTRDGPGAPSCREFGDERAGQFEPAALSRYRCRGGDREVALAPRPPPADRASASRATSDKRPTSNRSLAKGHSRGTSPARRGGRGGLLWSAWTTPADERTRC